MNDYIRRMEEFLSETVLKDKVIRAEYYDREPYGAPKHLEVYLWDVGGGKLRIVECVNGYPKTHMCVDKQTAFKHLNPYWRRSVVPRGEFIEFLKGCKWHLTGF